VILGALLVQGVRTGPALFDGGGSIVYTFIFGLFIATILMLPTGLLIGRYAYKTIVTIPEDDPGADGWLHDHYRHLRHPQFHFRCHHHDRAGIGWLGALALRLRGVANRAGA
jgi:hypothetical protein